MKKLLFSTLALLVLLSGCALPPPWVHPIPLRYPFDGVRMRKKPKAGVPSPDVRISWIAEEGNWTGLLTSTDMLNWSESVIISRHRPVFYTLVDGKTAVKTMHVAESTEAITTNFAVVVRTTMPKQFFKAFSRWER